MKWKVGSGTRVKTYIEDDSPQKLTESDSGSTGDGSDDLAVCVISVLIFRQPVLVEVPLFSNCFD